MTTQRGDTLRLGTALTAGALSTARREGYRMAVLQAFAGGQRTYGRFDFSAAGEFRE